MASDEQPLPGPDAVAGQLVTQAALRTTRLPIGDQGLVLKQLAGILPGQHLAAGTAAADRAIPAGGLARLVPSAAIVAAGLDPATPPSAATVLWQGNGSRLLVHAAAVTATSATGSITITIPVTCDQTQDAEVTVTFVTGTPDDPAGGLAATEDHPRGPAAVVEVWAEPLIALAWRTLITATSALSGAAGGDAAGRSLVTAGLMITEDVVTVTPMAAHAFPAGGRLA